LQGDDEEVWADAAAAEAAAAADAAAEAAAAEVAAAGDGSATDADFEDLVSFAHAMSLSACRRQTSVRVFCAAVPFCRCTEVWHDGELLGWRNVMVQQLPHAVFQ